jgi:hypothetical protein
MLRTALFVVSGVLLVGAVALGTTGCNLGTTLRLAIPGLILLLGLLVERWRYKPLNGRPPGPEWVRTAERFVDPESGKVVTVFYKPSTGERRYVAV